MKDHFITTNHSERPITHSDQHLIRRKVIHFSMMIFLRLRKASVFVIQMIYSKISFTMIHLNPISLLNQISLHDQVYSTINSMINLINFHQVIVVQIVVQVVQHPMKNIVQIEKE